MIFDIARPCAFIFFEPFVCLLYHFIKKCPRPGRRIKNKQFMNIPVLYYFFWLLLFGLAFYGNFNFALIRKSAFEFELIFKDMVNTSNNIRNNRLRGIINSSLLSKLWVILSKECFIKMNYRVFPFCLSCKSS